MSHINWDFMAGYMFALLLVWLNKWAKAYVERNEKRLKEYEKDMLHRMEGREP